VRASGGRPIADVLAEVKGACEAHPGSTPLFVHVLLPEHEVVVKVTGCRVDPVPELVGAVEGLLGRDSVVVEYARRA
jgi:hypothetical protein